MRLLRLDRRDHPASTRTEVVYALRVRIFVLAALLPAACTRPTVPDVVTSDPSTKPISDAAPPPPMPQPSTDVTGDRICEPTIRCGFWSGCIPFERVDATHYRALSGTDKDHLFVRRHDCWPSDAGPSGCSLFCNGPDAGPPCVDGLQPEAEACSESAPPTPYKGRCSFSAGVCGAPT
jgi:hypothetical protein